MFYKDIKKSPDFFLFKRYPSGMKSSKNTPFKIFIYLCGITVFFASCAIQKKPTHNHQAISNKQTSSLLKPVALLQGVLPRDIARAQASAKKQVSPYWKHIAKRSIYVRERLLNTLRDMHAPLSLQVIPIIESGYQPYALSPTGAMGLWQLMPRTAYALGIHKNRDIDGRRHIEQSTRAAVHYLQKQYQRFHNWPLAFAAYNMGPYGLAKRLKKTPWTLSDGLENMPVPKETRNYVYQIIGLTALLKMHTLTLPQPMQTKPLHLYAPIDLQALHHASNLPRNLLFQLNPSLHYSQYLQHNIQIYVPNSAYTILSEKQQQNTPRYIQLRIRSGNSLWSIARHYHTSIHQLKKLNPTLHQPLKIGHFITVPAHSFTYAQAKLNPLLSKGRRIHYKVRKGDSLWKIAHRFGTTTRAISRTNQLSKRSYVHPGERLWILARIRPS